MPLAYLLLFLLGLILSYIPCMYIHKKRMREMKDRFASYLKLVDEKNDRLAAENKRLKAKLRKK